MSKKKLIIIIATIFIISAAILLVIFTLINRTDNTEDQSNIYTDPYTNQVVDSRQTGGQSPYANTNEITFLGMPDLLKRGITYNQMKSFQSYIYIYSNNREANKQSKITEMTIDLSTISQTAGNQPAISFDIILNRDDSLRYKAICDTSSINTLPIKLYKGDSLVFDSNAIPAGE